MFNQNNRSVKVITVIFFITFLLPTTFVFSEENEVQQDNYYLKGQYAAKQDYKGVFAFLGGTFFSTIVAGTGIVPLIEMDNLSLGITFSVIVDLAGWCGGYYLFAANRDTNVPQRYNAGLDITQWSELKNGYKDYVNNRRKKAYLIGTSIGVGIGILLMVLLGSDEPLPIYLSFN
jgi:hypothetical protein